MTTGEYNLTLSGTNGYTGGTWVVGDSIPYYDDPAKLTLEGLAAIPVNDRVHLEFGNYVVKLATPGVVKIAELHVSNDSNVGGINAAFDADVYYLEGGQIERATCRRRHDLQGLRPNDSIRNRRREPELHGRCVYS